MNFAIYLIATCARSTGADLCFCYFFARLESIGYTSAVSSKKRLIGFGSPCNRCDASRSSPTDRAASLSVPPVLVARTGGRKARRFAQAVPGLPTRSSHRPHLEVGTVVFANRTAWRPHMAHTAPIGATASKISVSGYRCENWRMDGPPPLIINPEADFNALVAWCWGEASDMSILVSECCGETDMEVQTLASLLYSRLPAMVSILEHIADNTGRNSSINSRPTGEVD